MKSFEREVLQPAVLAALSTVPYWTGAVVPVERLFVAGRKRSAAEIGAGTPDILGSVRWRCGARRGAQFVGLELKSPALRALAWCRVCWEDALRCHHRGRDVVRLDEPVEAGVVKPHQEETHAAWISQGRAVYVVRSPAEALVAVEGVAQELRACGLVVD